MRPQQGSNLHKNFSFPVGEQVRIIRTGFDSRDSASFRDFWTRFTVPSSAISS